MHVAPDGTLRSTRSVVMSWAFARLGSVLSPPLSPSRPAVAGSADRASPELRIANVGGCNGKLDSAASEMPAGSPAPGVAGGAVISVNAAPATPDAFIAF